MHRYFFYLLIYFIGLIIQFGLARYFSPGGVAPDVLLVTLVFMGLVRGSMAGQVLGFMWGLSWDVLSVGLFGSHVFVFTCIGYLSGKLSRKWNESKVATQMMLMLAATLIYWFFMSIVHQIFGSARYEIGMDLHTAVQPVYNMLIAPIVFKIVKAVSYFCGDSDH